MNNPHRTAIPAAWGALLSREQLCAYLGGISGDTLRKVCPVPAVDLGANVLRYRRGEIDAWLERCPHRGLHADASPTHGTAEVAPSEDAATLAVERARRRAAARG